MLMLMMVKLVTSACEEGVKRKGLKFFCCCVPVLLIWLPTFALDLVHRIHILHF